MVNLLFWTSDSAASQPAPSPSGPGTTSTHPNADASPSATASQSFNKRQRLDADDDDDVTISAGPIKKARIGAQNLGKDPHCDKHEQALGRMMNQFDVEVLLKHNELRLVNQELAKCQVALEQLRRCHLVPYPTSCPTPDQMVNITDGKGPAVTARAGEAVPKWAPPFGVVDGPYARHYAKWLIPDPSFDGVQSDWSLAAEPTRARGSIMEGRATRNSFTEPATGLKGRPARGSVSQKLQALPAGYPPTKEKAGPCILKRADGLTVKLVCLNCQREDFSSTQGFINHCRIAHKCEFKSHEEAAMRSGQPVEVTETGTVVVEEKPAIGSSVSAAVHIFAREDLSEQATYAALNQRVSDVLKTYNPNNQPEDKESRSLSGATATRANTFKSASDAPHLSQFLKDRGFNSSLHEIVNDAKTKMSLEDISLGEESDDMESSSDGNKDTNKTRAPVVMRVPARTVQSLAPTETAKRPTSSKGRASAASYTASHALGASTEEDVHMDGTSLSPNALASNIAPSLVSDDGEYDDSDEGSSVSGSGDTLEAESISDVAEISVDDEHDARTLRRGSNSITPAVKFRKGDTKEVTFMAPVKSTAKDRRRRKA